MIDIKDYILGTTEREVLRQLFLKGPTWDGNIVSKSGRGELCKRGYAHHEFGYAWLTRAGVEYAVKILELDKS